MSNEPSRLNVPSIVVGSVDAKLRALSKTGRILKCFFFLLFIVFVAGSIAVIALLVFDVVQGEVPSGGLLEYVINPLLSAAMFLVFAAVFLISGLVFTDISQGESPFTAKQARRIRAISWLLFIYATVDSLVPKGIVAGVGHANSAVLVARFETGYTAINVGMFASAMIFYFLSSVFKYGVELQELSDDIV